MEIQALLDAADLLLPIGTFAESSGTYVNAAGTWQSFPGIANPVGVKIGPGMTREWIQDLVATLNPTNKPGRLTLIHRFGAKSIEDHLPDMIRAVQETGSPVLWVCDPMHGNTESTADGVKTRRFDNIVKEASGQAIQNMNLMCGLAEDAGLHQAPLFP